MPRVSNPFYKGFGYPTGQGAGGYNSPQMADASRNIGALLLSGPTPNQVADRGMKQDLNQSQVVRNRSQAAKYDAETGAINDSARMGSDTELFNTALSEQGIDHRLPNEDVQAMLDADPELKRKVVQRFGAYRASRALPGKTNYQQFQAGVTEGADRSLGEDVLAGKRTAGSVGEAIAAREAKPLVDVKDDTRFSRYLMDAPMTTTGLGEAKIGERNSQSRENDAGARRNDAQAGNYRAEAGEHGAKTKQINEEVRTGIRAGPPVLLETDDGRSVYASPREAVGGAAGARPKAAGQTTAKLPFNSGNALDAEINAQLGPDFQKELTPDERSAIRARASQLYPQIGNITDAVKAARGELGLNVVEEPGRFFGTNKRLDRPAAKAAPQTPGQMVAPPAQAAAAVPPPAQRKVNQTYPTPKGPMKWTGTGWLPAQ
jgi:hypothetical protein